MGLAEMQDSNGQRFKIVGAYNLPPITLGRDMGPLRWACCGFVNVLNPDTGNVAIADLVAYQDGAAIDITIHYL